MMAQRRAMRQSLQDAASYRQEQDAASFPSTANHGTLAVGGGIRFPPLRLLPRLGAAVLPNLAPPSFLEGEGGNPPAATPRCANAISGPTSPLRRASDPDLAFCLLFLRQALIAVIGRLLAVVGHGKPPRRGISVLGDGLSHLLAIRSAWPSLRVGADRADIGCTNRNAAPIGTRNLVMCGPLALSDQSRIA